MHVRAAAVACSLFAFAACGETLPPVTPAVYSELTQADVTAIAKKLVELRGLTPLLQPKVMLLPPAEFKAAVRETHHTGPLRGNEEALSALLGLLPPTNDKPRGAEGADGLASIGGFYHIEDRIIRMPNRVPTSRGAHVSQRSVLAHELHHAMQYQQFKPPVVFDDDARLAWSSLIEGDASVAQLAHSAFDQGLSASRMLRRARYRIAKPEIVSAAASPTQRSAWEDLRGAEAVRRFPYEEGLAFVVDLYRAGGFALIDQAYARPPQVTEHILHPEKYLANELPRAIGELGPPPGWKVALSTPLGELRTRVFLEPCLGIKTAVEAAAGWNGDRSFVLESDRSWMLGWVSAWDTEGDAVELEDGLARMGKCLLANDANNKPIGARFSIRRNGSVVAFARGGEQQERGAVLEQLLALPQATPDPVPVANAVVPPLRKPPEPTGGEFDGDVYRNHFFGITASAPSAFVQKLWVPRGSSLNLPNMPARKMRAGGSMGNSIKLSTPDRIDSLFAEQEEEVIAANATAGYETMRYQAQTTTTTGLGPAYVRSWTQRRGVLVHRVTIIPICGGTGNISLTTVFSTVPGRELMDYWVQSFQWTAPKKRPPICEYLDPEATGADR